MSSHLTAGPTLWQQCYHKAPFLISRVMVALGPLGLCILELLGVWNHLVLFQVLYRHPNSHVRHNSEVFLHKISNTIDVYEC